ncbi:AraC family transcriptional regulator [Marinobacter sp. 2_MG-2023]|uniref:AraC family transcriptional regulator n=1 Tax=Marinobacter sp. 2_MG-2023 TaxID=3062679 RepID=UPI0026E490BB|nr:AraC family transcriptional regulator [Marinobacter sp. 2_MG-2023]MDO6441793.1 AraC family transcriptional regulator [Marinobacter sp. 2_MG-2023]
MNTVNKLYAKALSQYAERAGLAISPTLLKMVDQQSRLPLALLDQLWDACCQTSKDPLVGLRIGLELQPGHLDSAGLLLMTCTTLGEALEQLTEVAPIVGGGGDFTLVRQKAGKAAVHYQPRLAKRQAERVEAALAAILNLGRWASGDSFTASEFRFMHEPLASRENYSRLLGVKACFQSESNALVFSEEQLALPLVQANNSLHTYLRHLTDRTLAELGCQSLSAETQRLIERYPRWGKDRIAVEMSLSGRHLNRKLAEEGYSFKSLRDSTLHRLALERLQGQERLVDIADALGFSDESAFAKAFRRWTGTSPAKLRRRLSDEDNHSPSALDEGAN